MKMKQETGRKNKASRFTIQDVVVMAMMLAIIELGKRVLDFIPNVELVTLLFIVFTVWYGWKTMWVAFAFIALETMYWGVNTWVAMYLYIWPLLIILVMLIRPVATHWMYCVLAGAFGLLFGTMCTLVYLVIGGPQTALAWWVAGIPYDILHGISNFVLCLVLFKPLNAALKAASALWQKPEA